jgi:hypothetical protein
MPVDRATQHHSLIFQDIAPRLFRQSVQSLRMAGALVKKHFIGGHSERAIVLFFRAGNGAKTARVLLYNSL